MIYLIFWVKHIKKYLSGSKVWREKHEEKTTPRETTVAVVVDGRNHFFSQNNITKLRLFVYSRGNFGARDYRNPAQLRGGRGGAGSNNGNGTHRGGHSAGGYNNRQQQQWDGANGSTGGHTWNNDRQSGGAGGYDRYQQQNAAGNGNRQADPSWWDNTSWNISISTKKNKQTKLTNIFPHDV